MASAHVVRSYIFPAVLSYSFLYTYSLANEVVLFSLPLANEIVLLLFLERFISCNLLPLPFVQKWMLDV